jgi:hypothetical protein
MSAPKNRSFLWLVPFAVYLLHSLLFSGWIVDDAGISFAYARHLAQGHGLVSQPGMPPVEGYSNPLWVFLLALPVLAGVFDPIVVPKVLSLLFVAGAFALLDHTLRRLSGGSRAVSLVTLLLVAVNTPFVIWTSSGLENPLYAFLFCLLLWIAVRERENLSQAGNQRAVFAGAAGLTAAAIALTRPEGVIYVVLYPLLTLAARKIDRSQLRAAAGRIALYAVAFAVPFGLHFVFRVLYFGDLVPNTYYAKGEMGAGDLLATLTLAPVRAAKLLDLMRSVAGPAGPLLLLALVAVLAWLLGRGRLRWAHLALLVFAGLSGFAYLLLPDDWMAEYRMATSFFPFFYALIALLAAELGRDGFRTPEARRLPALVGGILAVGLSMLLFTSRSFAFVRQPTIPFSDVVFYFGDRYNRYADALGVENPSILLPDLGGALWTSKLRVYDLAGLCDRTIAKTRDRDPKAFYDYIFGEVRPTFLRTYYTWSIVSPLERDPRFQRDYVPLVAFYEPEVKARTGHPYVSGEFVRRDIAERHPDVIATIRNEMQEDWKRDLAIRLNLPRPTHPGLKPGGSGPIPPPEEAMRILAPPVSHAIQ